MRLRYKILWVENELDFVESFPIERVAQHIEGEGFEFELEVRSTPQDVKRVVSQRDYDLLLVDYNITEDEFDGADLIRKIRDNKCLTEVIFYSSAGISKLHEEASSKQLEGVFFSSRREDQLIKKIKDLFDLTVEKVLDLNNMRGIVMAGVSDLDAAMEAVIRARHKTCSDRDKDLLCRKIVGKIRPKAKQIAELVKAFPAEQMAQLEGLLKQIDQIDPAEFEHLVHPRRLDSSKRVDLVAGFCDTAANLGEFKEAIQAMRQLLKWRNALAHQRPLPNSVGLLEFEIDPGVVEVFDGAMTKSLRTQILEHTARLERLLLILEGKA
jgi:CheY-like chemotaxis protein